MICVTEGAAAGGREGWQKKPPARESSDGGEENPRSRFERRRGGWQGREVGGGKKTPPARDSSDGGVGGKAEGLVARRWQLQLQPSSSSSPCWRWVVARKAPPHSRFERRRQGRGVEARKPPPLAIRATEGLVHAGGSCAWPLVFVVVVLLSVWSSLSDVADVTKVTGDVSTNVTLLTAKLLTSCQRSGQVRPGSEPEVRSTEARTSNL
jgi:hypothetical protein